ncbi:PREDICTED: uncharacterized protein LOC101304480 [Fragaria vesca subsp. vesca]
MALLKVLAVEPDRRGTASSALQSEFFTSVPLPSDLSTLPKYPPSKEFDAKLRDEEARRQRAPVVKDMEGIPKNQRLCQHQLVLLGRNQERSKKCITQKASARSTFLKRIVALAFLLILRKEEHQMASPILASQFNQVHMDLHGILRCDLHSLRMVQWQEKQSVGGCLVRPIHL